MAGNKCAVRAGTMAGVVAAVAVTGVAAEAATIVEYFNGYGTTSSSLSGTGAAGAGWKGAWGGNTLPRYAAGTSLSYGGSGYSNAGNGATSSDGVSGWGLTSNEGNTASRFFNVGGATSDYLTGTIWISFLATEGGANNQLRFWLANSSQATPVSYIGLNNLQGTMKYGSAAEVRSTQITGLTSGTHLMLARIVINASGANDNLDLWIDPTLTGGIAGLGTASLSKSGSDVFGAGLGGIGVSFHQLGAEIDSIRISNDVDAFIAVTAVPEPTSLASIIVGGSILIRRRPRGESES